jgi:hypothetical protein
MRNKINEGGNAMKKFFRVMLAAVLLTAFAFSVFAGEAEDIAAKHRLKLWNFETGTTEGWHGAAKFAKSCSVNSNPKYVTEGKYSLKVDLTGSKDWNQDVMVNSGPFDPGINKLVELSFDVIVPESSVAGLEYEEMYLVTSSKSNAWYQLKSPLQAGTNKVVFKIDNSKINKDMWNIYLVTNNSQPFTGPIYIDNMVGRIMGEPGIVSGKITDKDTGAPVAGARVVVGDVLAVTDSSGDFTITIPEDVYKMVVVAYGYKDQASDVTVVANKTAALGNVAIFRKKEPKKVSVNINIDPAKVIRIIDPHKLYGQNIAAWHRPEGYRDNVALAKLQKIGATYFRIPGGDYGNLYDWKTGEVNKYDGSKGWTPDLNYMGGVAPFLIRMNTTIFPGQIEALPIINILTPVNKSINQRIDYGVEWLQNMKEKGIKFRYVEIGNELDNKPDVYGPSKPREGTSVLDSPTDPKVKHWWTVIDNYCKVFNQAAYKIKKFDSSLKIMGPVPMQPMNQESVSGDPWKATGGKTPFWVEEFLKKCGKYMDTLAVHEYPFWANNDARLLLTKPQTTWPVYMPQFRKWIKRYVNSIYPNKYVEVALTEWNSGDENVMTALIENGLFCADYLGSFMKCGGDMAFIWDLYTQKPGSGGGHGLMDEENDPTNKFSERSHYWVFDMYYNKFGNKMIECESSSPDLSVYASKVDDNTISIMAINKTKLTISSARINIKGATMGSSGTAWQLSDKEYVWSKELYRPIINSGPTEIKADLSSGTYDFPPYSVTVLQVRI